MTRIRLGWDGDETDLQQRLLEALGTDVMIHKGRPGEFTFEITTTRSADDLRKALEDHGIDDVF